MLLPTLPTYIIGRLGNSHRLPARLTANIKHLPIIFEVFTEVNLAVFYIMGTYYDTIKRILGVRHVSLNVFHSLDSLTAEVDLSHAE